MNKIVAFGIGTLIKLLNIVAKVLPFVKEIIDILKKEKEDGNNDEGNQK